MDKALFEEKTYIEDDEVREEVGANTRIYGIDPGNLPYPEEIISQKELELYLRIDSLATVIFRLQNDVKDNDDPDNLTEYQYALEFCMYQTRKFGVELPNAEIDKHVLRTESYNKWTSFWHNHFINVLSSEEKWACNQAWKNGEDISRFLPNVNWQETLEEPDISDMNVLDTLEEPAHPIVTGTLYKPLTKEKKFGSHLNRVGYDIIDKTDDK